jgi:hypothetical protein
VLINLQTPDVQNYRIFDCGGSILPLVQQYDTETKEVTLMLHSLRDGQQGVVIVPGAPVTDEAGVEQATFAPLTLTFVLHGSYATYNDEVVAPGEGMHPVIKASIENAKASAEAQKFVEEAPAAEVDAEQTLTLEVA